METIFFEVIDRGEFIELQPMCQNHPKPGDGFKYVLFSPLFGEDSHGDYIVFFRWVDSTNHPKPRQ